jgi:cytochrome c peroxidase
MLIFGCERSAKKESSKQPSTAETDPLAQPKSLQQVGVPAQLTQEAIPPDNPQTPEKISLGQKLFFERRLSADGTVSCGTCHDPQLAFTDRKPLSVGIKGRVGQRNAPTILKCPIQ